jgi:hypothetical protein
MSIVVNIIVFFIGLALGVHIRNVLFSRLEWSILKWDNELFAYRPAKKGIVIHRNDKVYMALRLPTANMPNEGLKFD